MVNLYYESEVLSYSDYYPFGMEMLGRSGNTGNYRFGFQGQEIDKEVKGEGNSVNYKYRMHDPRLGRFFAVDPLAAQYPFYTPYSFSGNRVIDAVEVDGLHPVIIGVAQLVGVAYLSIVTYFVVDEKIKELTEDDVNSSYPYSQFSAEAIAARKVLESSHYIEPMVFDVDLRPEFFPIDDVDTPAAAFDIPGDVVDDKSQEKPPIIMYHYTNSVGMAGILLSQQIFPSTKAKNPRDAKYDDGVYWSDIVPGTLSPMRLALNFLNVPNKYIYTHFVAVDVSEFVVKYGRDNVYVTPTNVNLPVVGKIVGFGKVPETE